MTRESELDEELKRLKKQLADTVAGKDKTIGHLQGPRLANARCIPLMIHPLSPPLTLLQYTF